VIRKVVASEFLSLDGVAEEPNRFVTEWDDEVDGYGARLISTQDTVLLGRRTYDAWAAFWPTSEIEPFASFINAVEKFVVTSSPPTTSWSNTAVVDSDLFEFVTELKGRPGGDIGVHGSIELIQSLLERDLVDEFRLAVAPALQMDGRRLFDKGVPRRLTLTRHVISPTGYLLLDYQVDTEAG
jgi:dihydrofolate reductase